MRYRGLIVAFMALCLGILTACSGNPLDSLSRDQLTYENILNTGIANTCLQLEETTRGSIAIDPDKSYALTDLCLEPTSFFVEEEPANKRKKAEFVPGKLLTRATSTLDQVSGSIQVNEDGSLTFLEEDGIDFQAITVQLPGGEQTPFFFTIKQLVATTKPGIKQIDTSTDFEGEFKVPSYRGAAFLDPKGRGTFTGYDNAVALPAGADSEDYARANVKEIESGKGEIFLQITKVDGETGEIAGVFESEQPSDTDLGSDEPELVKIRGIFYARVQGKA